MSSRGSPRGTPVAWHGRTRRRPSEAAYSRSCLEEEAFPEFRLRRLVDIQYDPTVGPTAIDVSCASAMRSSELVIEEGPRLRALLSRLLVRWGKSRIQIYRKHGIALVVICSELPNNPGGSVTNSAEV